MKKLTLTYQGYFLKPDDDSYKLLQEEGIQPGQDVEVDLQGKATGSQPMLATWMMWMGETARFMASEGVTMPHYIDKHGKAIGNRPFDKHDAHELFTGRYLGRDENGKRKSWKRVNKMDEVQAGIGDRLHAMNAHEEWATQRGIRLTIPRDSEFRRLNKKQEE